MFGHERFEAYQTSIKFLKVAIYLADKERFYAIARGSAMECTAICDVLGLMDQHYSTKTNEAKAMLKSIVSILTTNCSK